MSKLLKVLPKKSKKKRLQNKKDFLIAKIQKCKNFKEIEGWTKTMSYYPVLSKDFDWDYGFLLELIRFKLKRMSIYFHTHNIVVDEERYSRLCNTAISLLNIGYLEETYLDKDLGEIYVNIKNKNRFLPKYFIKRSEEPNDKYWSTYGLATIRTEKAKKIFWKFMNHYIELLWD